MRNEDLHFIYEISGGNSDSKFKDELIALDDYLTQNLTYVDFVIEDKSSVNLRNPNLTYNKTDELLEFNFLNSYDDVIIVTFNYVYDMLNNTFLKYYTITDDDNYIIVDTNDFELIKVEILTQLCTF